MPESPFQLLMIAPKTEDHERIRAALQLEPGTEWVLHNATTGREGLLRCFASDQLALALALIDQELPDILTIDLIWALKAVSGQGGLRQFEANRDKIDLVLLDMKMPVMDGEQTYHALRSLDPTVKILLPSGDHDADTARHLTGQRFTGFLNKPYSPDALLATIQGMIQQKR